MPEEYGYTGTGARTRVGVYAPPTESAASAVLLVPTLGDERRSLVRAEVELARRLADSGRLAVRFDPAGDSDSPVLPGERDVATLAGDVSAAFGQCREFSPRFAVTLRAGSHLLGFSGITDTLDGIVMAAPVRGEDFVRGLFQRQGLRKMLGGTEAAAEGSGEVVDIDGVAFRRAFLDDFAAPCSPLADGVRLAVLQIGPAREETDATRKALETWLRAGAKPALPASLPDGVSPSSHEPVAVWRHPILWGQTEYSGIGPLAEFVLSVLDFWENADE